MNNYTWDTVIIGAGAAGLFCAGSFDAAKLVLEHNACAGRKLNVTGGGRCNFTHRIVHPADYRCSQKHFCQAALAAFTPQRIIEIFRQAGLPIEENDDGCLFSQKASEITEFLVQRAQANHTHFSYQTEVLQIIRARDLFCVITSLGKIYARRVVVASGGLSYPQLGAGNLAWKIAAEFNLITVHPEPVLVGWQASTALRPLCRSLAGQSLPVSVHSVCGKQNGSLLFTHEGISGPVVLQSSLLVPVGETVQIDFLPNLPLDDFLRQHKQENKLISSVLRPYLSPKISQAVLGEYNVSLANASKFQLQTAEKLLKKFDFEISASGGFARAEATAGGIEVSQLDRRTLACKTIPNLFFIGEAVDVTGRVGGFNLHWAWASAWAAAQALKEALKEG